MPVRFQVDPDFYDHPKVTGMSDAAFALWVRAGSYSAAKLTDGLVSEDVLAHTLRYEAQVADELVQRGLWRRTRGGWRFHQWENRNLTRKRVESDRESDRKRKRSSREKDAPQGVDNRPEETEHGEQNQKPQDDPGNVRPDTNRSPKGTQPDSKRNPTVSVSVSSSVSSSGSYRGEVPEPAAREKRPPERCPKHANDLDAPPCGACGNARRVATAWDADEPKRARAERLTIRACPFCDADGWRYEFGRRIVATPYQRCDHTPPERP